MRYAIVLTVLAGLVVGCSGGDRPEVVVYTALDEMYSAPILEIFEKETGITVKPVYDTEAAKTTGLVTRLIAERDRPRADVFWNNETAQTILLKEKGILTPHGCPEANPIPQAFKDPEGYWAGLAARGRVIIYNTDLVETPPASIQDFLKPEWKGKCAVAMPLFGTTATHAAALFALWGEEKALAFFSALRENEVAFLAGNATVRDAVGRGDYAFGLTDTDDANGGVEDGLPVKWLFPDQDGMGTLVIPNTVALIANGPNPDAGRRLVAFLLTRRVESALASTRSIQIPLKPGQVTPENVPALEDIVTMKVDFADAAAWLPRSAELLREELAR